MLGSVKRREERRTGRGRERVGRAEHGTAGLDGVKTLPNHSDNGTGSHILDESGEEGLLLQVLVVYRGCQ